MTQSTARAFGYNAGLLAIIALTICAGPLSHAQTPPAVRYDLQNGYSLAFVDADVRRVADAILGAMLSVDYSVDPDVTGNVTLRSTQPVTKASLLPMLEQALQSVDAVIVRQGNSYRIVSRKTARSGAPVAASSGGGSESAPGYASEIVTLKFASTREMSRLIEQFLGKEIVAGTNDAQNQIVLAGTGGERQAARELIARFDVDTLASMAYELYRLDNVDAGSIVSELQKIFQAPYDIIGTRVRIVPLPRLRSVLLIASDRSDIARVEPWIRKLDIGVSGKRKLYNYMVQNGRARDIASALQQVLGGGASSLSVTSEAPVAPLSQGFASANGSQGNAANGSAGLGGESGQGGAQMSLPSSSVSQGAPPQESYASGGGGSGIRIVPNDQLNALIIYADGEEYELVREALQQLDRPVPQVLIEATLAEVTLNNDLRYGVDFQNINGNRTITNVSNGSGVPASNFPGFSLSILGNSTQAILNMLQSKTDVKVLSAPKLMVLNNQTATLQVGDQVPIITQQSQSVAAPGAPVVNNVELRDTGVILRVTPRVNDSGTVTLDIAQEVSDVAETTTSGINSPTIQQRRLSSTVATRSGEMIALGGLIRDRTSRTRSGLPLLSQIPVIGAAFGRTVNNGTRTELIILLTPTVLRSPVDVKGIVDQLIDSLDTARPLVDRAVKRQVGGKAPVQPLMPSIP